MNVAGGSGRRGSRLNYVLDNTDCDDMSVTNTDTVQGAMQSDMPPGACP